MSDTAGLSPEDQAAGQALAGRISVQVQNLLLDAMNSEKFAGARNAVLNGALWAICSAAKSARDADPEGAGEKPLEQVVSEQAALFLAAMAADEAMGIEQGTA